MQKGIDSFFKRVGKKQEESDEPATVTKKRKKFIISSDEDEEPASIKNAKAQKISKSNDEVSPVKKAGKPNLSKLKKTPTKKLEKIDPSALFGAEPTRVHAPKPKESAVVELDDEEIDRSLMEIDVDESALALQKENKQQNKKTPPKKKEKHESKNKTPVKEEQKTTPSKRNSKRNLEADEAAAEEVAPHKASRRSHSQEKATPTPKAKKGESNSSSERKAKKESTSRVKKEHKEDLESSVLSDEERHERKRMAAILYQKYKNRSSSCINPGSKEVPKGKPNCLAGLNFVVTGILESLEREEAQSIIKEYGGKISSVVGKRLNYLIAGEEAGPKKLAQADEFGISILTEDGLFDLIRERSGEKVTKEKPIKNELDEKPSTSKAKKAETVVKKEKLTPLKQEKEKSVKASKHAAANDDDDDDEGFVVKKVKPMSDEMKATSIKQETATPATTASSDSMEMLPWVEKYKPASVKDIIGQQGPASNVAKLTNWLAKWYTNHDGKKKLQKPNPWAKNDDGAFYKAALLSGPPGIGKTTTATLVCKELGFDVVEFNASDTRSKRLLKEEVSELLKNKSLFGYCHGGGQALTKKHVLIMDEVDGMAGNEDRGGIQELIGLIKESSVPIICMCNDRNHQKMRSLVNYCYDLRFQRPRVEQIKGRLLSILCREKMKIETSKLEEIIAASNNDIRQSINHISMLSASKDLDLKPGDGKNAEKTAEKDLKIGPWEVIRKVFSAEEHKNMSIYDKCDLFFHDYSMAPLFVQQNYLQVSPHCPKNEILKRIYKTADALSLGDLVDKRIRSRMAWSLLPTQAVFSSYMPGEFMKGHFTGQINFPAWLGKFSRANKRSRLAQEIHDHTRVRTSGSRLAVRLDYAPHLLDKIVRPLKELGMEGVEAALDVMKHYKLLREDLDSLLELTSWPGKKQDFDSVDGRVKAALTRAYNKEVLAYSYSAQAGVKKKRAEALDEANVLAEVGDGDGEAVVVIASDEDEDDDKLENDGLIKAKKKPAAAASKSASTSKAAAAGTSKSKSASTTKKAAGTAKAKK